MTNPRLKKYNAGFTLIEILVACSIMTVTTFALLSAAGKGVEVSNQALRQTQADFLAEEGAEAVKSIRDTSWSSISSLTDGTTYYLSFDTTSNTWSLSTIPNLIDSFFTRTVVVQTANRDTNDNIASSGTPDSGTKEVAIDVSWPSSEGTTLDRNLSFYMSDIFN
jgi:prepilin-type N-terminal cleavage/methylation domain-containing protein